jgi:hypothetical protein
MFAQVREENKRRQHAPNVLFGAPGERIAGIHDFDGDSRRFVQAGNF